jgi:hypothetical protein
MWNLDALSPFCKKAFGWSKIPFVTPSGPSFDSVSRWMSAPVFTASYRTLFVVCVCVHVCAC